MATIEKKYPHPEYLVETNWLEQNLDTADLRVFDCTVNVVPNPDMELRQKIPFVYQSGRNSYQQAHIPNAGFIDIPGDLSDRSSDLPLMVPSEKQFVETMSRCGISDNARVVLYSTSESNWAARVWWMLRAFGFDNVALLNGGWRKWTKEERPISNQGCLYKPEQFTAHPKPSAFVNKEDVLAAIGDDEILIINALPSGIFTGSSDIAFGRKGRIADSVNVPFVSLQDPDTGGYLSSDQLRKNFDQVNVNEAKQIITYCGGGIAASNDAFTLNLLGYDNVAVYDGSMLEWGNDASLPMEMG
ncbi:MAG: sulfurtransferase [Ectothiorhodospiraceae bacterium]|nr:sulfurtransferase [Ectothiorhodospiraceae bacterium]